MNNSSSYEADCSQSSSSEKSPDENAPKKYEGLLSSAQQQQEQPISSHVESQATDEISPNVSSLSQPRKSFFDPSWTVEYVDIKALAALPEILSWGTGTPPPSLPKLLKKRHSKPKHRKIKSNAVRKCNESNISNMTSSVILAATTKSFEDLKRARLNTREDGSKIQIDEDQGQDLQDFQKMAAGFQEQRQSEVTEPGAPATTFFDTFQSSKPINQVWGSVINQQLMSEVSANLDGLGVQNSYGVGNRGIENYITRLMRKRTHEESTTTTGCTGLVEEESELSSDGLSDDSKIYLRERKKKYRKSAQNSEVTVESAENATVSQCAASVDMKEVSSTGENASEMDISSASMTQPNNSSAFNFKKLQDETPTIHQNSTLSTKTNETNDKVKPKKRGSYMREKMMGMDFTTLGNYLATRLREKNRDLIVCAANLLGKETCINMYFKVLKIESGGGLLIKSKARRRTRGGVFLYLIRNSKRLDQQKVELLFQEDKARRIETLRMETEENKKKVLMDQGMDEFQFRMQKRMTTESVAMQEKREQEENSIVCDIDKDEEFSFSVDKLVHHKPGFIPQEGPVINRNVVLYDDIDMMEEGEI